MTAVGADIRVCPSCGSPAGLNDACPDCGTQLASLLELPTRAEWEARTAPRRMPPLRPLLHPTERSRLALAVVAAALTLVLLALIVIAAQAAGALVGLLAIVVFSLATLATIWISMQLYRARLLGRSVRVDSESMPALQALVDDVRETLHYHRRVDFYVTAKPEAPITTMSYMGTRIVILEGSLVAELMEPAKRAQLTFLVGRSIGSLRAKHMRVDIVVLLLDALNVLRLPSPFILPWYRATSYSGDQIGMMCCGDLEAALEAMRRVLVGGELASKMGAGDVLPQATLVQRRILPRLAQLFLAEPHPTNRYANLLCFGRYHDPGLWDAIYASLDDARAGRLDEIWWRSPHRRRTARLTG